MIYRLVVIVFILFNLFSCDTALQPELVSVNGKDYDEIIDPIIEHPKLLIPIDSLKSSFNKRTKGLGFESSVFVKFTIDSNGTVLTPVIMRGENDVINQIAIDIIKSAMFEPARQNGQAVTVQYIIPFISN